VLWLATSVTAKLPHPSGAWRLARCPLCPDSDQILQRAEMTLCAINGCHPHE
jgi:hypothetical protein